MTENQRCFGKTETVPFLFFTPEGEQQGTTSLVSISFSLLKGREGHRHRGITVESVAARNQTTAGFSHGLESRRQRAVQAFIGPSPSHLSHKIGFVEALPSAEKGQSRLWGQARLKWNNQWNGAKYNAFLSECKS